ALHQAQADDARVAGIGQEWGWSERAQEKQGKPTERKGTKQRAKSHLPPPIGGDTPYTSWDVTKSAGVTAVSATMMGFAEVLVNPSKPRRGPTTNCLQALGGDAGKRLWLHYFP